MPIWTRELQERPTTPNEPPCLPSHRGKNASTRSSSSRRRPNRPSVNIDEAATTDVLVETALIEAARQRPVLKACGFVRPCRILQPDFLSSASSLDR